LAVACKGGKYATCPSTSSDEQYHPILRQLHLRQLENVYYDGGEPWMLIPDGKGVLHIAVLTEISPPVTGDVAADIKLNLYTK
jgi:hypothetical protein